MKLEEWNSIFLPFLIPEGALRGKVNLNVKLKIFEFLPETDFSRITNPCNISKRVLTYPFTHYEPIIAKLAVCIVKQSTNKKFGLILNFHVVMRNHTSSHVFPSQNTRILSKFIIKRYLQHFESYSAR